MESSYLREIAELKTKGAGLEDNLAAANGKIDGLQEQIRQLNVELEESRDYGKCELNYRLVAEVRTPSTPPSHP
eukprot:3815210-Pyramimonas_sp.AAC.1